MVDVPPRTEECLQRFYRARPTAAPVFPVPPIPQSANNNATPRANDGRRVAKSSRASSYGSPDSSTTWTSRERIKAATCVSLSRDGRFLAVGETGYSPRVIIFSLKDSSPDRPLVSISEHGFGVRAVAWSQDGRYLASLGTANDGFLFVWKIDPRNGSARLFQQNRCTSYVAGMIWLGSNLITFGTRHVKSWKVVDEAQRPPSPPKKHAGAETTAHSFKKTTLPGRNVLLGSLLEATFTCALPLGENHALLCSEGGDVCLVDDTAGQMKLMRVTGLDYAITCCAQRGPSVLVGGKNGQLVSLSVEDLLSCASEPTVSSESGSAVLVAMGFAQDQLVTIGSGRSVDVWRGDAVPRPGMSTHMQLPGQGGPVLGVQSLARAGVSFFTWSASGRVFLWDIHGRVQESFDIIVNGAHADSDMESSNQLAVVRADENGKIFAAGDRLGVLRIVDHATGESLLETKAHTSEITHIAVHHAGSKAFVATSGRDRTVQIYNRTSDGPFALLQTLEFPSRVTDLILSPDEKVIICSMDRNVQIHELVSKVGEPNTIAAIQCRSIALKAAPASMCLDSGCKSLFVSSLDRSVHHFDVETGQTLIAFKTTDENSSETAVLDSLVLGSSQRDESPFLLGLSNTDKSVRIYDACSGAFIDREWGHTESITGVALVEDEDETRRVVSVGCDGTIMIWGLGLRDSLLGATSRSPSPATDISNRPPLRRVLSKAEIAEFPRPSSSYSTRRSPPPLRPLRTRKSRSNMSSSSAASARTPTTSSFHHRHNSNSPSSSRTDDTPSRRTSSNISGSPAATTSPASGRLSRRPSMPSLGTTPPPPAQHHYHQTAREKSSAVSLRSAYGLGSSSLQAATEQTFQQLRSYRARLSSSLEHVAPEVVAELEAELRLTAAAVSDRGGRHVVGEPVLTGLLDRYSERLVSMLDERLRLRLEGRRADENGGRVVPAVDGEPGRPHSSHSTVSSTDT